MILIPMSAHAEQVASVLRRSIQELITRGLNDPRVRGLISVTEVKVSPDLADAAVLVSVHPAEHASLTARALQHASGHIRGSLARRLPIRRVPRLRFHLDDSIKKEAEIHAAIARATEGTQGQ